MGTIIHDDILYSGGGGGGSYTLPIASANTLGGIKVGNNLSIDNNGTLSADANGDIWTSSVLQTNNKAIFDNLNPNYGYKLCYDDEGAMGDITVPGWTNINKSNGTTTGTIKLTYTVNGTDGVSKFKLRVLK